MTPAPTKITCPACGSPEGVPLLWGLPDARAWAAGERGELVIGGCDLPMGEGPLPNLQCLKCHRQWQDPTADRSDDDDVS
jgi:hypothetical protein